MGSKSGFYRVKLEERNDASDAHKVLALHVYRDGIEVEALEFELSDVGCRNLVDEIRWLEWNETRHA